MQYVISFFSVPDCRCPSLRHDRMALSVRSVPLQFRQFSAFRTQLSSLLGFGPIFEPKGADVQGICWQHTAALSPGATPPHSCSADIGSSRQGQGRQFAQMSSRAAADAATRNAAAPMIRNDFLAPAGTLESARNTIVVVLNWTLPQCSARLLSSALLRICADGGANQLFDELPRRHPHAEPDAVRTQYLPHAITGDMDSARSEVLEYYEQRGAQVIDLSKDQDTTDLHKCLAYLEQRYSADQLRDLTVIVLGGMGGRIDHTLSNLNTLLAHRHLNLVLLGDSCTARLLPAGKSTLQPAQDVEGPSCSLVPLAGRTTATTTGLQWNLDDLTMEFGGLISTSNMIVGERVEVDSDQPLLWTTEIKDRE